MKKKVEKSRSKKALINTIAELLLQLVNIICGFILPKLILSFFGSTYNGIAHSITQFIGCIELLKSGIGGVTRAALYKPLANKDSLEISKVVYTTEKFMRKIAIIFSISIIIFSIIYPFIIHEDLPFASITLLVLILSLSTFVQYFFGITYQMVLQADQRNFIISIAQIIVIIASTLISALLIKFGFSIHIVKLGSAIVYLFPPIFYMCYVKKRYRIKKVENSKKDIISQRWDAFGHQVANFININTDVIVITIFLKMTEVSVYSVYNMITHSLKKIITSISSSATGAFGNMYAKKEEQKLLASFKQFELLMYLVSTIVYTTSAIVIVSFVREYVKNVTDANYIRPFFSLLMCIAGYLSCVKLPYETIVYVAGKFKETKKAAYVEAGINILFSLILVNIWGINGILVGTIIAGLYRLFYYNNYVSSYLIKYKSNLIFYKLTFTIIVAIINGLIFSFIQYEINGYVNWIIYAIIVLIIVSIIALLISFIIFKEDTKKIILLANMLLKRKRKNNIAIETN